MKKIVGIGFKEVGKIYWFNPGPLTITTGSKVVVETVRGLELGHVVCPIREVNEDDLEHDLKDIIRIASPKDIKHYEENEKKAKQSVEKVKEIVKEYKLEMKTLGCEYTLDGSKLLIYYNADGRVDFRELVKALASEFKVRIELRQIGQREGAKLLGAIGPCGREVCCKKHLREFDLVTMKMAKDQGMALSSSKIAGVCGKLMCCIGYESEAYAELRKRIPRVGEFVKTPTCEHCKVVNADYLREIIKTDNDGVVEEWDAKEVKRLKKNNDKVEEEEVVEDTENLEENIQEDVVNDSKEKENKNSNNNKKNFNNKRNNKEHKEFNKENKNNNKEHKEFNKNNNNQNKKPNNNKFKNNHNHNNKERKDNKFNNKQTVTKAEE